MTVKSLGSLGPVEPNYFVRMATELRELADRLRGRLSDSEGRAMVSGLCAVTPVTGPRQQPH
jgi:hypothetical protein